MATREIYQLPNKPTVAKTDLLAISDESDNHKSKNILVDALIQLIINSSLKKIVFLNNDYTVQPTDNNVVFSCQSSFTITALPPSNYPDGFSFTIKHDSNDESNIITFIPQGVSSQVDYFGNLALSKNQGVTLTLELTMQNWMSSACAGGGQDYWPYNNANMDSYTLKISDNKNFIAFPPTNTAKLLTLPSRAAVDIRRSFLCFAYCPPTSQAVTISSTDDIEGVTSIPPGQIVMIYKRVYGAPNVWVVTPLGFDVRALLKANNLSDLADVIQAKNNLGLGVLSDVIFGTLKAATLTASVNDSLPITALFVENLSGAAAASVMQWFRLLNSASNPKAFVQLQAIALSRTANAEAGQLRVSVADGVTGNLITVFDIRPGQVGINGAPDPFALIDMQSTNKAPIFPRMTQAQRDAMTPQNGMQLYNTTVNEPNFYANNGWKGLFTQSVINVIGPLTITAVHRGSVLNITAGAPLTINASAASTLGIGFPVTIKNSTAAIVTFTVAPSDSVDNQFQLFIMPNQAVDLVVTGTFAWKTMAYSPIGGVVRGTNFQLGPTYTLVAADHDRYISLANTNTLTLPQTSTLNLPIGYFTYAINVDAPVITIQKQGTEVIFGATSINGLEVVKIVRIAGAIWLVKKYA